MNSIPLKQNKNNNLSLVRARRRIYETVKTYQGAVVLTTLALPLASLAAAAWMPEARAYVAAGALLFAMCEVIFLDRWSKKQMKCAAKLQEQFDCDVLEMRPNEFLVGARVDPEEVYELSAQELDAKGERELRDWYPVAVGDVPMHVGRILCQRENLLYDGNVRKAYSRVLRAALVAIVGSLTFYSLLAGLSVEALLLTVIAPALPIVNWTLREFFRQRDTMETLERLKAESEKLWNSALAGMPIPEVGERSRELQDALFNHRVASPLVFDFLYRFRRNALEAQMNAGAVQLVSEFRRVTAGA